MPVGNVIVEAQPTSEHAGTANGNGHSNGHSYANGKGHHNAAAADLTRAPSTAERDVQKAYWSEHSSCPTVEAMMLDSKAAEIDLLERPEVLALLGPVSGQRVVELGAGIGRFTGELAARGAAHITAVDFMDASIAENRRINGHHSHIDFRVGDVTELVLEAGVTDVVFSNWLLMYLNDEEVSGLAASMLSWVRPGGRVFFRESCFKQSGDKARKANPTHYRNPREYFRIFDAVESVQADGQRTWFELNFCKCVDTYVRVKHNQNQICWCWTKVVSSEPRSTTFRNQLDSRQYSPDNILRYESIYGPGFMSCGGLATATSLAARLHLKAGERVLDLGCGVGGSTYHISEAYKVHCHGLDLSVNNVLAALERTSQRPAADVTFEVADCTTRDFADGSYDVIYSRDVLLHVKYKRQLFKRMLNWLKPGGRVLITDYCLASGADSAEASPGFKAYLADRGYSLVDLPHYSQLLQEAGFVDVVAEDNTEQFKEHLSAELARLEASQADFVAKWGKDAYSSMVEAWQGKIERATAGEQRWGLFTATRPAVIRE